MRDSRALSLGWIMLCVASLCACGSGGGAGGGDASTDAIGEGPDAGGIDAPDDAAVDAGPPVMSITQIFPTAASRLVDTGLRVTGANLATGATLRLASCDSGTTYDLSATVQVAV